MPASLCLKLPQPYRPIKGTPFEFDDNLNGFGAVWNMVLRKPGSYIDGIPAKFTSQIQNLDDGRHNIVSVSVEGVHVQGTELARIICLNRG